MPYKLFFKMGAELVVAHNSAINKFRFDKLNDQKPLLKNSFRN